MFGCIGDKNSRKTELKKCRTEFFMPNLLHYKKNEITNFLKQTNNFPQNGDHLRINISNDVAGSLIGNHGDNIKFINKNFNCRMCISRESDETDKKRYVYLSGKDKFIVFSIVQKHIWNETHNITNKFLKT